MEFLGKLGIDAKLLIAQVVNFGLLLWLLRKFLYKPIIKRIEKDEKELEQAKFQNKKLEKEKEIFLKQQKQESLDSKKQAQKIIKEAESIAQEIRKQAHEETEQARQAVIKQIKLRLTEIENEKEANK